MSRLLPLIAVLLLAAGAVLFTSMRSLQADRDRLLEGFAADQLDQTREAATDLRNRLEDLDEDARLLKDLVTRARSATALPREVQDQTTLSSFEALATVVRAYRGIVLVSGGAASVAALDPSETEANRGVVLASSLQAVGVAGRTASRLVGPFAVGKEKDFYFHVTRLGDLGSIVIAVEPRRFLAGVLRPRADARQAIEDPSGRYWIGCAQLSTCRLASPTLEGSPLLEAASRFMTSQSGTTWLPDGLAQAAGLPAGPSVAAWTEAAPPTGGSWRVLTATSAASARAAMSSAAKRLVGAAGALIAVMAGIGTVIVWQQRRSAALQERIRHIERVQSLEDQLVRAEKLATTGVLAAGIAHEIGTPLGIIRGRAELLLAEPEGPALRPGLGGIIQQIDHIAGTIGRVLDFSRAQPVSLQPVRPDEIVRATIALLEHRFRRQKLSVDAALPPDLPPAAADPAQLQQVLVNLLMNACDACPDGGKVSVKVERDQGSARLRWTIQDSGCGIEPGNLRAVFDPFFTTKKRGEGTGLGLTVAANIIRNHDAEISLTSKPGHGTSVTIMWPIAGGNAGA
jgi:signal transduction histidine kinase